jgi:RNA polymerase sigma-70 factor (ECF subfamily)
MQNSGLPADSGIHEEASDQRLVEATLGGSEAALAVLHRRYYARVYRVALVRCRHAQDAEDVASETFVRAIQHLSGYRFQGDSLFPYLARIASNLIADQGRKARGVSFISLEGGSASDAVRAMIESLPSDPAGDPQRLVERQEVRAMVRAAIAALPDDQADAVLLRFGGDMPLKEIAEALHKSEGAVKSLLHRALNNLRRSLSNGETAAALFGHSGASRAAAGVETQRARRLSTRGSDDLV